MIARRQRRALAAGGDIGGTEIKGDGDAGRGLQQRAIADLPGPAASAIFALGTVRDGMAVKADDRDILAVGAGGGEQAVDGDGV